MSITSKGERWELFHSLWIGWTFFPFLYSIAFFNIGFRTGQKKWVAWGTVYLVPFVLFMLALNTSGPYSWQADTTGVPWLLLWPASIFHAFWVRKEYLLRLDTLQSRRGDPDTLLKRRLAAEYGEETRQVDTPSPVTSDPAEVTPERGQDVGTEPPATESPSSARTVFRTESVFPKQTPPTAAPAPPTTKPAIALPDVLSRDELEYQISSSYPFPLAFGFRSLMSIVDPRDLYREQLRIAENMLAFLASVSLALLREQDRERAGIDPKEFWLTGISPGDWKEIVARCSRVFAGYENDPLASAIKGLSIRSEKKERSFGANMAALIRAKNDYKHDRGPVVLEDITDASKGVQERLRRCMEALAFSTAYPIRQVEDCDVARRGGVILKCLRYTGDHPSFPQEEIPFHQALPRGDLFIDLGNQGWAPLFPFMTTMTCPHCKVRETYFIDAWDTKRGTARMKSFERGHTMNSTEVFDALSEWTNGIEPEET